MLIATHTDKVVQIWRFRNRLHGFSIYDSQPLLDINRPKDHSERLCLRTRGGAELVNILAFHGKPRKHIAQHNQTVIGIQLLPKRKNKVTLWLAGRCAENVQKLSCEFF